MSCKAKKWDDKDVIGISKTWRLSYEVEMKVAVIRNCGISWFLKVDGEWSVEIPEAVALAFLEERECQPAVERWSTVALETERYYGGSVENDVGNGEVEE